MSSEEEVEEIEPEELEDIDRLEDVSSPKEGKAEVEECPECGGHLVEDPERGELICDECGLVLEERKIQQGPEWRAYTKEEREKRARTGAPETVLLHEKGLTTEMGRGTDLSPEKKRQFRRLRQRHKETRMQTSKERSLSTGLQELRRMASQMGLPNVMLELAASIYKQAVEQNLLPGRSIEAMASASLYMGSRISKAPRTLDEISEVAQVPRTEIGRAERYLRSELEINVPPISPVDYLPRLASETGLSSEVEMRAKQLIEQAEGEMVISGRDPMSIAAAALYLAARMEGESVTQREVAEASRVSEVTIRNRYKELQEMED